MRHKTLTITEILVLLILGFLLPLWSHAETVIENHVKTSASTGGQTSGSEGSSSGESTTHTQVKTTVNGEVVTDINETETSSGGSASTGVKVETVSNKSTTTSKVEINGGEVINTEPTTDNQQLTTEESPMGLEVSGEQELLAEEKEHEGDGNPVTAFLGKIFKYVFSIFTI